MVDYLSSISLPNAFVSILESKMFSRLPQSDDELEFDIVSSFDRRGEYVYSGNAKGRIQVMQLEPGTINTTIITSFRVSNTAIKQIEFAPRKKNTFLVNSSDRVIRVYNTEIVLAAAAASNSGAANTAQSTRGKRSGPLGTGGGGNDAKFDPEPVQKLQDLINRTTWRKCCFSGVAESEFICAGSARQHALYIWDLNTGALVKILHGIKGEILNDVIWHPVRPVIASIAMGVVSTWSQTQVENWSAFAPDFKELDENIEYEERESEFDELDEDRTPTRQDVDNDDEDDALVDVDTPNTIYAFLSRFVSKLFCLSCDHNQPFLPTATKSKKTPMLWSTSLCRWRLTTSKSTSRTSRIYSTPSQAPRAMTRNAN